MLDLSEMQNIRHIPDLLIVSQASIQQDKAAMDDEMNLRLESLDEWVMDDHKTISYRWLANELRISTRDAKR